MQSFGISIQALIEEEKIQENRRYTLWDNSIKVLLYVRTNKKYCAFSYFYLLSNHQIV
jgi:hypothetical protein